MLSPSRRTHSVSLYGQHRTQPGGSRETDNKEEVRTPCLSASSPLHSQNTKKSSVPQTPPRPPFGPLTSLLRGKKPEFALVILEPEPPGGMWVAAWPLGTDSGGLIRAHLVRQANRKHWTRSFPSSTVILRLFPKQTPSGSLIKKPGGVADVPRALQG